MSDVGDNISKLFPLCLREGNQELDRPPDMRLATTLTVPCSVAKLHHKITVYI